MDVKKTSEVIVESIGGKDNVECITHCATRLRIKIKDYQKVNREPIEALEDVLAVEPKENLQIVIGAEVPQYYEELVTVHHLPHKLDVHEPVYNRAKLWQILLFVFNNTSTNTWLFVMNFISYYAVGIAGLGVSIIGMILTGMRIFDGITDPLIGYWIDKTDGKFGKFRPFMVAGNIVMIITVSLILMTTHLLPAALRLPYFILVYAVYIIGYTFQTACTKAGQACLTNDPKQRPVFSMFDGVCNTILFTGGQLFVAKVIMPITKGFNAQFFHIMLGVVICLSIVLTTLAVIGIWSHDRTEFFGLGAQSTKITFKDFFNVIKSNRAIQMLVVSASTDKLSATIANNAILVTVLYGILIGDYGMSGTVQLMVLIPTLVLGVWGTGLSRKSGLKKALVVDSWLSIGVFLVLGAFLMLIDTTLIKSNQMIFIAFLVLLVLKGATQQVSNAVVIPMIADCADYETYKTGRYVPGMMGTLFSFVDKIISAFATTFVTVGLAMIGYGSVLPQPGDPITSTIKIYFLIMFIAFPVIGLLFNVVSMKFYPLTREKMEEIQAKIAEIKAKA